MCSGSSPLSPSSPCLQLCPSEWWPRRHHLVLAHHRLLCAPHRPLHGRDLLLLPGRFCFLFLDKGLNLSFPVGNSTDRWQYGATGPTVLSTQCHTECRQLFHTELVFSRVSVCGSLLLSSLSSAFPASWQTAGSLYFWAASLAGPQHGPLAAFITVRREERGTALLSDCL